MTVFLYKARDQKGKIIEDNLEASSKEEAANSLREDGYQVLTIKVSKKSQSLIDKLQKVTLLEKAIFCRYLATMMKAGLPLSEAVEVMSEEASNKKMHRILIDMQYSIQRGQKLSSIFSRYPEVFSILFITMTKAGEESGTLEQSFSYLSEQLMRNYELTQKVKGALLYPAVIISAMIGVGVLMITFVLPRISKVFLKLKIKLPVPTRILLTVSNFLGEHYLFVIFGSILLFIVLVILFSMKKTKRFMLIIMGKIPIIAKLFDQLDLARFSRTLSTLLKSGVPILESIKVSVDLLTQPKFNKLKSTFEEELPKGKSISEALSKGKDVFPSLMVQSIKAGEKSGGMDTVLTELADFYEKEVENSLKSLMSVLEPVLMLIIGVAVGAMVVSIIAPIYSVIGTLQDNAY